jgi:arylsulfatase A-like enzyme
MLGDHGLMAKTNFYKPSVRNPLTIRPPGGGKACAYDKPVQAIDIIGTLLDVAGAGSSGS